MKEYSDDLFVTKVIGVCFKNAKTIEQITEKIYKNQLAKNIVRVYQCCMILMQHGILVPKVKDRLLMFQVDLEVFQK